MFLARRAVAQSFTLALAPAFIVVAAAWAPAAWAGPDDFVPVDAPPPAYKVDTGGVSREIQDPVDLKQVAPGLSESKLEELEARAEMGQELPGVKEGKAVEHYTQATFYTKKWNLDLAEVELEEAIRYWPDFKAAHRDLCLVELFRGNLGRSFAEALLVGGLYDPIPLGEAEARELDRKALKAHYNKGVEWGRKENWQDALAEFQWALSYGPYDPVVHRSMAFVYAAMGDFAQAERAYEETFALNPGDAFAHADFAQLLSKNGRSGEAEEQLSTAVKLAPRAAALHVDLGWMAENKGDLDTARSEFKQAADLSPRHAWLWAHLGKILERQGKSAEAIKAYDRALTLDPKLDEARQRLAKLKPGEPS